jgi:RimJ/RimL family protein N-acetyltransferase
VPVVLRPEQPGDLALLSGGESPFDDFGPRAARSAVRPAGLDDAGGLVVLDEDGSLAGAVSWHYVHWGPTAASRCPMIGIWLRPSARGRGVGRAAQRALAELFFAHTAVNRVEAHTDVDNVAEQRALEGAGFTREGLIRGAQWREGTYRDGYLYSVLRAELTAGGPARTT